MTTTVNINGSEFKVIFMNKMFAGYGHNKITCQFLTPENELVCHSITTNNTILTDRMSDDSEDVVLQATAEAAEMVIENWMERK